MPASLRSISDISICAPPEGMSQDLLKIFEKYRLGERADIARD
jgi:hypothetical protein